MKAQSKFVYILFSECFKTPKVEIELMKEMNSMKLNSIQQEE
jgi:hypothetical protein